jgi:PAS domain S-box-containing protein
MRASIRTKLLAAFGLVVVLMTVVGLFAVGQIGGDHARLDQLAKRVVPITRMVSEIGSVMNVYRKDQLHHIVATPAERPFGVPGSVSADGAGDLQYKQLKALLSSLNERIVADADAASAGSYFSSDMGLRLLVVLLIAAIAISVGVALILGRRIIQSVDGVGVAAKAIAEGDISQNVEVTAGDELGDMATDFGLMVDYLAGIAAVAESIAGGDLSIQVKPRSEHDVLGRSLAAMTQSLREAMSEKERLIEQITGVVTVFDVLGDGSLRFVYVSRQSELLLGVEPATLIENADLFIARVHDDDREQVRAAVCEPDLAGDASRPTVFRFIRPDGEEVWLHAEAAVVSADDRSHRVQAALFDITAAKRAELERERLELDLRLAQKLEAVGQLAAGIAHEINTPIQFIGDSVTFLNEAADELLKLTAVYRDLLNCDQPIERSERRRRALAAEDESDLEYLTERVPPAFTRALDGIDRVSSIVRAMRQFGHPSAQRSPTDINEALQNTLIVSRNEYKYLADIELDLAELPPVMANASDLNQVFLNLVVNAAHAIESRQQDSGERGTITISTRQNATGVLITVSDTGCGISPEIAGRVFDPFFTTKAVGQGTGQGLAIAHTIVVERHHGAINFEPNPSGGTTFRVQLPLDDPEAGGELLEACSRSDGHAQREVYAGQLL